MTNKRKDIGVSALITMRSLRDSPSGQPAGGRPLPTPHDLHKRSRAVLTAGMSLKSSTLGANTNMTNVFALCFGMAWSISRCRLSIFAGRFAWGRWQNSQLVPFAHSPAAKNRQGLAQRSGCPKLDSWSAWANVLASAVVPQSSSQNVSHASSPECDGPLQVSSSSSWLPAPPRPSSVPVCQQAAGAADNGGPTPSEAARASPLRSVGTSHLDRAAAEASGSAFCAKARAPLMRTAGATCAACSGKAPTVAGAEHRGPGGALRSPSAGVGNCRVGRVAPASRCAHSLPNSK
mmetsp:Transcript_4867/g.13824  ORF Transcript_4867/g.13824 Transcript_4867/m.13824 type:complete len:291 (+) Transcript_4867:66-938(+)